MSASDGGQGLSPGIQGCRFPKGGPACLMHRTASLANGARRESETANLGYSEAAVKHYP
jgi:hypothetical protein